MLIITLYFLSRGMLAIKEYKDWQAKMDKWYG